MISQFSEHSLKCLRDRHWKVTTDIPKITAITDVRASSLIFIAPDWNSVGVFFFPASFTHTFQGP